MKKNNPPTPTTLHHMYLKHHTTTAIQVHHIIDPKIYRTRHPCYPTSTTWYTYHNTSRTPQSTTTTGTHPVPHSPLTRDAIQCIHLPLFIPHIHSIMHSDGMHQRNQTPQLTTYITYLTVHKRCRLVQQSHTSSWALDMEEKRYGLKTLTGKHVSMSSDMHCQLLCCKERPGNR